MLYTISRLTQRYQNRTVLDIESLAIPGGTVLVLLGPNGAGKTTLLNILGFLTPPTTGAIRFRSQTVRFHQATLRVLRRQVILVDQHPILFTTTVRKNIEFGLKIRQIGQKERAAIINDALDLVGMRNFEKARANRLSGGETQRVALARALALQPQVLLCDEPTSSVDVENQTTILEILQRINTEKKITVIFTTHDTRQARALAHQTLFLENGRPTDNPRENIFIAKVVKTNGGGWGCVIHDTLRLPLKNCSGDSGPTRLRIHIDQRRLSLAPADKNAADGFQGNIVQLSAENDGIRAVVDIGVQLGLNLSLQNYQQHRLHIGQQVKILGIEEALQILP